MDMETIQLVLDAGPNAVQAFKWYALATFGETLVWAGTVTGILVYLFKSIAKGNMLREYWESLSLTQQKELAEIHFKKKVDKENV